MNTTQKVLLELLTKNAVAKQALLAISDNMYGVYKSLERLEAKDCIREISYVRKVRGTRHEQTIDYVVLTTKGYEYARKRLAGLVPWVAHLENTDRLFLQPSRMGVSRVVSYFLRVSTPAVMVNAIPGSIPTFVFTDNYALEEDEADVVSEEDEERNTLGVLVRKAIEMIEGEEDVDGGLRFVPASEVKASCNLIPDIPAKDVRAGKFSGVIVAGNKTAVVYMSSKSDVLIWHDGARTKEMSAFKAYRYVFTNQRNWEDLMDGLLIVDSIDAFVSSFFSKSKSSQKDFGNGFDHFWVVPVSRKGVQEIDAIFNGNIERDQTVKERGLVDSGEYIRNTGFGNHLFSLYDLLTDTYTALVTHIDICQLKKIISATPSIVNLRSECAVLCYDWQVPYLEAVLPPDIEVRVLDS